MRRRIYFDKTRLIKVGAVVIVLAFLLGCQRKTFAQDPRAIDFNSGWKFHLGDGAGFEKSSYDDASWRSLELPHDWSIEGPFSEQWASGTGYLPGGIGWYRKSFKTTADVTGKIVHLYFDGVYKNSEVWINDQYLGKRPNGYTSFYYDITKYLNKKGKNVIAVKVDHSDFADSRWYPGSGINRKVYLIQTNPIHIDIWGVAFKTPVVSEESATAHVTVDIKNNSSLNQQAGVTVELLTLQNELVVKTTTELPLTGKTSQVALQFNLSKPRLWSPDHPALYKLKTTVLIKGKVVDVVTEQVGFREFKFDPEKGFFLNGKALKLNGVCIHDDAGALGSAVPAGVWERRLKTLKSVGCNAIRMSHNPHQDYLYDLCDRLGFLVQDEAFDEWEIGKNKWIKGWNVGTPGKDGYNKDFKAWADRDVTDMILRNRNRACIIMWSIGNEIDYPNDPYTHEVLNTGRNPQIYGKGHQPGNPPAERLGEIAKQLVSVAKKADSTRPITAALAGVVMSNETTYPEMLDIVGYNYQEYRYEDDHKKFPQRIIYGSENGQSQDAWRAVEQNEFISGQFLWTGIDFLGEARAWPIRSSGAGLLDLAGFPKPQYYLRKMMWCKDTALLVTTGKVDARSRFNLDAHWNYKEGDSVNVACFTNAEEAELFLNGKSLGRKSIKSGERQVWKVLYSPGEIVMKGFSHGVEVAQQIISTGTPQGIVVTTNQTQIAFNRDSVSHLEIRVRDSNGQWVNDAENEMELIITGPGKLIGLESGSLSSHEDYKSNRRKLYRGRLLAYIQATGKGKIRIEVVSNGLTSGITELQATGID